VTFVAGLGAGWVLFSGPESTTRDLGRFEAPRTGRNADGLRERTEEAREGGSHGPKGRPNDGASTGQVPSGQEAGLSWDRPRLRAEVERAFRNEFRLKVGRDPTAEEISAKVDGTLRDMEQTLPSLSSRRGQDAGAWVAGRELLRAKAGTLSDAGDVVLQVRGQRGGHADLLGVLQDDHVATETLASAPLDMETKVRQGERTAVYVHGGVLPLGKALLVQRVELVVMPGVLSSSEEGAVDLEVGGDTLFERRNCPQPFKVVWTGSRFLYPGQEERTRLEMMRGAASVRIEGTLMDESAISTTTTQGLTVVPEECSGFMRAGRIVLQVLAAHGGGNPQGLALDGATNSYLRTLVPDDLTLRVPDMGSLRDSLGHMEGGGLIPPGRHLVVKRVDISARVLPGKGTHGEVVVRVGGRVVFQTKDTGGDTVFSSWTEGATINSGDEREVSIQASYYSFVEAVLTTEIE